MSLRLTKRSKNRARMNFSPSKMWTQSRSSFNTWNISRIRIIICSFFQEILESGKCCFLTRFLDLYTSRRLPIWNILIAFQWLNPCWILGSRNRSAPSVCQPCSKEGRVHAVRSSIIFEHSTRSYCITASKLLKLNSFFLQFRIPFISIRCEWKSGMHRIGLVTLHRITKDFCNVARDN